MPALLDSTKPKILSASTLAGYRVRSPENGDLGTVGRYRVLTEIGRGGMGVVLKGYDPTLARTTMGHWRSGHRVNLERAIKAGDRLGGHMVQGHVDGVARVTGVRTLGDARLVDLALPPGLTDLMVIHGSIAVDGVSLTINDLPAQDIVQLSLIDYTLRHTALDTLSDGDEVHVEADMIGKYVQKLVAAYKP